MNSSFSVLQSKVVKEERQMANSVRDIWSGSHSKIHETAYKGTIWSFAGPCCDLEGHWGGLSGWCSCNPATIEVLTERESIWLYSSMSLSIFAVWERVTVWLGWSWEMAMPRANLGLPSSVISHLEWSRSRKRMVLSGEKVVVSISKISRKLWALISACNCHKPRKQDTNCKRS